MGRSEGQLRQVALGNTPGTVHAFCHRHPAWQAATGRGCGNHGGAQCRYTTIAGWRLNHLGQALEQIFTAGRIQKLGHFCPIEFNPRQQKQSQGIAIRLTSRN